MKIVKKIKLESMWTGGNVLDCSFLVEFNEQTALTSQVCHIHILPKWKYNRSDAQLTKAAQDEIVEAAKSHFLGLLK